MIEVVKIASYAGQTLILTPHITNHQGPLTLRRTVSYLRAHVRYTGVHFLWPHVIIGVAPMASPTVFWNETWTYSDH